MAIFFTVVFGGVFAALAGAAITAWVSRSIKISEFRQAWINDLRKDISDYVGVAEKWIRKWDELNSLSSEVKETRERNELFPIANNARIILWRIKLRFSPNESPSKADDDKFLQDLLDLLNPGKLLPSDPVSSWYQRADGAIEEARRILKREWEVTKKLHLPRLSDDVAWRGTEEDPPLG